MKVIQRTIVSPNPPKDKNVTWIDTSSPDARVEKIYQNGEWLEVGAAQGTLDYTDLENKPKINSTELSGNKTASELGLMGIINSPTENEVLVTDAQGQAVSSGKSFDDLVAVPTNEGTNGQLLQANGDGTTTWVTPSAGTTPDASMSTTSTNAVQNKVITAELDKYAKTDGYYSTLTAGSAENLVGQTVDSEAYLIRPTGGTENEVANGVASVLGMEGNSATWNQLVNSDTTSVTLMSGRKYYTKIDGTAAVVSGAGSAVSVTGGTDTVIDLTLLGIDNLTTVAEVEAWLAQHVGTKPYYTYNAGTILSAQTLGIKTYEQNLLNPTTKQAKLIPYTWVENGTTYSNQYTIKNVPSDATATYTPDATGVAVTVDISGGSLDITSYGSGILELSSATSNTYVCMKWNGTKDNDVVPYEDHTYNFDVRNIYGKVNGEGEYIQCFPNGMRSIGDIHDRLSVLGAEVLVDRIQFRDLSFNRENTYGRFYANVPLMISNLARTVPLRTSIYISVSNREPFNIGWNLVIYNSNDGTQGTNATIYLHDTAYQSVDTFIAARGNVELLYPLATPITYTNLIYRDGGIDRPLADVLINIEVNNWSMEEQLMTPYDNGNPTSIPATIKTQYGMDAVEAIDTLQKTCYFADDVKANLQALLSCINTNCAETLGGTFSVSGTATDKVFEFTFTPNVEPTNEGE